MSLDRTEWGEDTFWESVARSKWGQYVTEVEKRVLLRAVALANHPTTALEIGCEGGRWSKLLSDSGWQMTCTDVNPDTLAICQRRIPSATTILVNANDTGLPCETSSLALILCIEVMPILWKEWFAREAWRVLKPEGLVVGVFENKLSLRGYVRHLISQIRKEFDYYQMSYIDWKHDFCKQGFRMLYEEGICWFPFSRSSNSSLVPTFTMIEQRLGLRRLPNLSPWIVFLAQKMPAHSHREEKGKQTIQLASELVDDV